MDKITLENKLFALFEKKLIIFSQYLAITEQIRQTLADLKEKELNNLFLERQQCITKIQSADLTIGELMRKMGNKNFIPNKIRDTIDRYLDKIDAVARTILPLDKALMISVKTESDGIKNELLKLRHSRSAAMTYSGTARYSPRFLDTRN